ncbi:uncharacterized protein METZ01_LOCUS398846, partial [marine metagenome]
MGITKQSKGNCSFYSFFPTLPRFGRWFYSYYSNLWD